MRHTIFLLCLLFFSSSVSALNTAQLADSAYNNESYSEAIGLYHKAIESDGLSSDLCYNLGNAYYRTNQIGKSILYYERALTLDPSNKDARTNLDFVKTKMEDAPEDDSSFLSNLHYDIISLASPNAWAFIALALFIIILATVALYIFSNNVRLRKVGFFGGIVLAFIFIYVLVIAAQSSSAPYRHDAAIVIVPTTNLSSMPRSTRSQNEKIVPIHEGTKVIITDSLSTPDDPNVGKWYYVRINNSSKAWLNAADVEKI